MEISRSKLLISAGLIVLLGILITVFSIYHTEHLGGAYFQFPLFLYGTSILSLIVGGVIVYLFEEKINSSQLNKLLRILPINEMKVLELLIERKEIEQRKLSTLAGINTVKVSRIISVLEKRGVIVKKKQGYTNLIILKL